MVYNGPSKGCRACRKRRVKCDQEKPACGNCSKRKVECPGYESTFDYRHRNETNSTILRAQQKVDASRRKSDFTEPVVSEILPLETDHPSCPPSPTDLALAMLKKSGSPLAYSSVPSDLYTPDPESVVLNWFFTNYPIKGIDPQSSHGFMTLLKPLYLSAPKDSPLKPAVAAVASNLLMLFCHQGSDTDLARKFYAQSITRMKSIIADPARSKQDDLILTTMALHFYDNINMRWNSDTASSDNHRSGALALLKHRGSINTESEISRHVTACMRTAVCYWALDSGHDVSPDVLGWLMESSVPTNKATELDIVSLKLVEYQGRFNELYNLHKAETLEMDQTVVERMISDGLEVDKTFLEWERSCPTHWRPLFASATEVPSSIRVAGFYGERCPVYWDLSICDTFNTYRIRRLLLLRMVRQLCIDALTSQFAETRTSVEATMSKLVDDVLECLPFLIGDITVPMDHHQLYEITYPTASNGISTYPNPDHDHARSAAASGGWLCSTLLMSSAKLALKNNHLDPFQMKREQFDWILSQLGRMQKVFLLSQPTLRKTWKAFKEF